MTPPSLSAEAAPAPAPEPRITCCVFVWDEIATLRPVVEGLLAALGRLGVSFELLIIDDCSTDGSAAEADRLAAGHSRVRVVHHGENRGLGGVYRTGFAEARGVYVTFFPADGQFPPENLARLYPLVESWDVVLGTLSSRRDKLGGALLGWLERWLYRIAVGPMPRLQGVFMFRREMLSGMTLRSQGRGWTVVWEFLIRARRQGRRMVECPIILIPRSHGTSKVNNLRNVTANLRQLLGLRGLLKD